MHEFQYTVLFEESLLQLLYLSIYSEYNHNMYELGISPYHPKQHTAAQMGGGVPTILYGLIHTGVAYNATGGCRGLGRGDVGNEALGSEHHGGDGSWPLRRFGERIPQRTRHFLHLPHIKTAMPEYPCLSYSYERRACNGNTCGAKRRNRHQHCKDV